MLPRRLTRPLVGRQPTMPLAAAGQRIDPPVSEPSDAKAMRAATATPEPLDEPHGTRSWPHGLRARGRLAL